MKNAVRELTNKKKERGARGVPLSFFCVVINLCVSPSVPIYALAH